MTVNEMTSAMLDAAKRGDMDEALRLKAIIMVTAEEPGYTDGVQINAWGDCARPIPHPDTIEDRQAANIARQAREAIASAKEAGTITAHVDAAAQLRRIGYTLHAGAIEVLAKKIAA